MEKVIVESPAKINLGLNVIGKRTDGYHDLETIFIPLLLKDIISFKKSDTLSITSNSTQLNNEEDNLIIKAIKLLEKVTNTNLRFEINLIKNIPIGGGLGGGSSNAATTLKTINKMMDLRLNYDRLVDLALQLGSDVPYFLNPITMYAESRGEILQPLNFEMPYPILIVNPGIKIDTHWAFGKIIPGLPEKNLKEILSSRISDFEVLRNYIKNDFEEIIFKEFPVLKEIKSELYNQGAQFALMSGTGSTVYGIFSNLQKAEWAEENFKQKYFTFLNNPFIKGSIT